MENREPLINTLLKHFLADLQESAKPLTGVNDLIYFAETLKEYLTGIYNSVPKNEYFEEVYFDEEEFIRTKLLAKFRDKMIPFVKTSFKYYFAKDDYTKALLFQKLKIDEEILNDNEYVDYINCVANFIDKWLEKLYLMPTNSTDETTNQLPQLPEQKEQKPKHPDYTRSRQLLLFHFIMQSIGYNRNNTSYRALAQFAHHLFYYPTDNIDNSEVYKQLKKAPYIKEKQDNYLLKDFEFVKKQFELIEYQPAIALVEKAIKDLKQK